MWLDSCDGGHKPPQGEESLFFGMEQSGTGTTVPTETGTDAVPGRETHTSWVHYMSFESHAYDTVLCRYPRHLALQVEGRGRRPIVKCVMGRFTQNLPYLNTFRSQHRPRPVEQKTGRYSRNLLLCIPKLGSGPTIWDYSAHVADSIGAKLGPNARPTCATRTD